MRLLFVILFLPLSALSQSNGEINYRIYQPEITLVDEIIDICESDAEYYGGMPALLTFLHTHLSISDFENTGNIEGIIYLQFVINKQGEVVEEEIIKGIVASIDKEFLRILKLMPDWFPATKSNSPVATKFVLPVKVYFR